MEHPVPEPYVWDESFRTFYELVDEQHQELFASIFRLSQNPSSEAALKNLKYVMQVHFIQEQEMLENSKYADLVTHTRIHNHFLDWLNTFSFPVTEENIGLAKSWLVDHIKNVDFKYKGKLLEEYK